MSVRRLAATITRARLAKEDAGYQRLLKAVFAPELEAAVNVETLPDPPLHPYSCVWGLVENDPAKWQ